MLRKALNMNALQMCSGGSTCSVFSIVPMEGSGTNEKTPELKRVRGSISAVLSDINESSNHRFGCCQGVNMLRFLHDTPKFEINEFILQEEIDDIDDFEMNVFGLIDSISMIRDTNDSDIIYYLRLNSLPTDKKVVIMSASIPDYIYTALYGDRVIVHDLGEVEQVGVIEQYTARSCTRHSLRSYHQEIREAVGDLPVITFSGYGEYFRNPIHDIYFGKCTGIDAWKGKDIAVVGTYHRNNAYYLLLASAMGYRFTKEQTMMTQQWVQYKGIRFYFMTYSEPVLQNIQISLIESELLQAVGRARTLRESNC